MNIYGLLYVMLVAFLAGALGALIGIGGGSIFVPLLDILVEYEILKDVTFHEIVATSLVCTIVTANTSSLIYIKKKLTNIRIGLLLGLINVLGVATGASLMTSLPGNILKALFGVFLIGASIRILKKINEKEDAHGDPPDIDPLALKLELNGSYFDDAEKREISYNVKNVLKGTLLSFFGGFLAGLLGIGGGVINVPIMIIILDLPPKVAAATSLFIIGLNGATGGLIYLISGLVNPYLVSSAMVGIFMGVLIGTKFLKRLRNETLRKIFAIFLFYVATRMLLKGFGIL